jgi:alpha-beta hydrolase superfamily lysophospholipase
VLADRLSDLGFCVLRFDYDGTGDSAGDNSDPDRVSAWLSSVAAALATLRRAGASSVTVVGMRVGALLGALAALEDTDVQGLVLWDPVASGRAYLREQHTLSVLSFEARAKGDAAEMPDLSFDAESTEALRALNLSRTTGPLARRVLVLARRDRELGPLAQRLDMPHVEFTEAIGQADLMEAGSAYGAIPYGAIDRIAAWVSETSPSTFSPVSVPSPAGEAVVARARSGEALVETPMFVGSAGLFGILTEAQGREGPGTTVLFLNVANQHRIGPGRLWVDLARRWAGAGFRCLRLDQSGLGDSPLRHPDQAWFTARAPEAFDDIVDVCTALSPDDPSDVLLVGLCSSAYQVLDSAFEVNPRGVVAINPAIYFRPPERAHGRRVAPRRRIAVPRKAIVRAYYQSHYQGPAVSGFLHRYPDLGRRLRAIAAPRHQFARWLREFVRTVVTNLTWRLRVIAVPKRRPSAWLRELVNRGVDVYLVCGKREARFVRLGVSARLMDRLSSTNSFHYVYIADLEHELLISEQRAVVTDMITNHVVDSFGPRAIVKELRANSRAQVTPAPVFLRQGDEATAEAF